MNIVYFTWCENQSFRNTLTFWETVWCSRIIQWTRQPPSSKNSIAIRTTPGPTLSNKCIMLAMQTVITISRLYSPNNSSQAKQLRKSLSSTSEPSRTTTLSNRPTRGCRWLRMICRWIRPREAMWPILRWPRTRGLGLVRGGEMMEKFEHHIHNSPTTIQDWQILAICLRGRKEPTDMLITTTGHP